MLENHQLVTRYFPSTNSYCSLEDCDMILERIGMCFTNTVLPGTGIVLLIAFTPVLRDPKCVTSNAWFINTDY